MVYGLQSICLSMPHIKSCLLVLIMVWAIQSRLIEQTISAMIIRRNDGWIFLDRIMLGPGQIQIDMQLALSSPAASADAAYSMGFMAIPDYLWDPYSANKCSQKAEDIQQQQPPKIQTENLILNRFNAMKSDRKITFYLGQPTGYHFVLTDCPRSLVNEYFNKKSKLEYTISIINDGSNLGSTQKKYSWTLPLLMVITIFCIVLLRGKKKDGQSHKQTNYVKVLVQVALYVRLISLMLIWMWYALYSWGEGSRYAFFEFMYLFFGEVSESILLSLFGFLAFGWTIFYKEHNDQQIYFPIVSMGGFILVILTMITKINDGDDDKYHMYDTIPTYVIMILKLICYMCFLAGIARSLSKKNANLHISYFFKWLAAVGSFGFLSLFLVYVGAGTLPRCEREAWTLVNLEWSAALLWGVVSWQLADRKSLYQRVSLVGKSFMERDNKYF